MADRRRVPDQPLDIDGAFTCLVWADLVSSRDPLVAAGFSSIGELIELIASWSNRHVEATLRMVLGTEPLPTTRSNFATARIAFTEQVQRCWLEEQGVSLRARAIELIEAGRAVWIVASWMARGSFDALHSRRPRTPPIPSTRTQAQPQPIHNMHG